MNGFLVFAFRNICEVFLINAEITEKDLNLHHRKQLSKVRNLQCTVQLAVRLRGWRVPFPRSPVCLQAAQLVVLTASMLGEEGI